MNTVAPFTLAFGCSFSTPIAHLHLSVNLSEAARTEISLRPWCEWTDKPALCIEYVSVWQSDNYTGPPLELIQRNVPQSKVTWPNQSTNVVTVTVFGNLYQKKNTADTWRSFCPPACPTDPGTFLPEKQHLSPAKNFNSLCVCNENKSLPWSALQAETSVNFPPENRLCPGSESLIDREDTGEQLKRVRLCADNSPDWYYRWALMMFWVVLCLVVLLPLILSAPLPLQPLPLEQSYKG